MRREVEFLTAERMRELKNELIPIMDKAQEGNDIARGNLSGEEVYELGETGIAAIFLYKENGRPKCILAIQFYFEGDDKGAEVLALAGEGLITFKRLYWDVILDWLRANDVSYLDAFVDHSRVDAYKRRFGFNRSCALVRMDL